ncbi:MAG: AAA family ATPase [Oscillospiraceae bacterium]|nr:AAA family ATPase [Oscillospiraceae bacterium]
MKIYSMTATFGKLEQTTLTLQPGLNIIEAPNEWGKSTWCAFLINMLYGIDTRARSTKDALPDKERYAPWSGSPMSGKIELCWQGRDITIERRSKGRTPLGVFQAYETETGLEIPELTAANCGQTLLGVERSVFTRAGFLRFTDLPVTQNDELRHRLNALVTTGDESGTAETLGKKLRDLKNACRHNKTGQLPKAEARRDELTKKLQTQQELTAQAQQLTANQKELESELARLQNHQAALQYDAAQKDARQVEAAKQQRQEAAAQVQVLEKRCAGLASREQAAQGLRELENRRAEVEILSHSLPPMPQVPQLPPAPPRASSMPMLVIGVVLLIVGAVLTFLHFAGLAVIAVALGLLITGMIRHSKYSQAQAALSKEYISAQADYQRRCDEIMAKQQDIQLRREALRQLVEQEPQWKDAIATRDALADARQALEQAERHLQALQAMAKDALPPALPDELTLTEAETLRRIEYATDALRQNHTRQGQCQGQIDAIGDPEALRRELAALEDRIAQLERYYEALTMAQDALAEATAELQRRFAPRLTRQAQDYFSRLTDGRYEKLTMAQDLTMQAAATGEDGLRSHLYRSDGTIDQLYLALRLAVARELTPAAPLILDDALVRFDDKRMAAALNILREEAQDRQIILFTCQSRESNCTQDNP